MTTPRAVTPASAALRRERPRSRVAIAALICATLAGASIAMVAGSRDARAGGARFRDAATGRPVLWTSFPVAYQIDRGRLGSLSNSQATRLVREAFDTLERVDTASIAFRMTGHLPVDVTESNWPFYFGVPNDGRSPVVFDADGRILDQILGLTARNDVEGAARLEFLVGMELREAAILLNGACFDGISDLRSPCELSGLDGLRALILHEAGHFCNLDHADLNREVAFDGLPGNNVLLPSMYAVQSEDDATLVSLHLDDLLALSSLYPAASFPGTGGTVEGFILAPNGFDGVNGANVIIRDAADRFSRSSSTVSGDDGPPGFFSFRGLPPGNYSVEVRPIASAFVNDVSVGRIAQSGIVTRLPGPAEFLSAPETAGGTGDRPDAKMFLNVRPGSLLIDQNIILNDLGLLTNDQAGAANDTFASATPIAGAAVVGDVIIPGDVDYFRIFVPQGWRLRVDVAAADPDLGSALRARVGLFNPLGVEVTPSALPIPDPASGERLVDPALEYAPPAGGDVVVAVASVGDDDFDGLGGLTAGPYYLRLDPIPPSRADRPGVTAGGGSSSGDASPLKIVLHGQIPTGLGSAASSLDGDIVAAGIPAHGPAPDADGDGVADASDPCPGSGDADGDGVCDLHDNCIFVANAQQIDGNDNGAGDRCDPPVVLRVVPPDRSFEVPLTASVEVRFSEPMSVASIGVPGSPASIRLEGPGPSIVPVLGVVAQDGRTVTLDPVANLDPATDYRVVVPPTVTDLDAPPLPVTFAGASFRTTSRTDPPVIPVDTIGSGVEGSFSTGVESSDLYGSAVDSDGDVNGDGFSDLLIGAPGADGGAPDSGEAVLILGGGGVVTGGAGATIRFHGANTGDEAGASVAFVGDVNRDGIGDFLIGAPGARPDAVAGGAAYLVFGQADLHAVCSPVSLSNIGDAAACTAPGPCGVAGPCGVVIAGVGAGDRAGEAVAAAGDFNHDGRLDLLVGAPGRTVADAAGDRAGAGVAYLLYGSSRLEGPGAVQLAEVGMDVPGVAFLGENEGDAAGSSLSGWRDRNADGVDDLIIASPYADVLDNRPAAPIILIDAGIVHTVLGAEGFPSGSVDLRDVGLTVAGVVFLGETDGANAGFDVSGEHDVTGDGEPDILIGGPGMSFEGRVLTGGGVVVPSEVTDPGRNPIKRRTSGTICLGMPSTSGGSSPIATAGAVPGSPPGIAPRAGAEDAPKDGSPAQAVVLRDFTGAVSAIAEFEAVIYMGESSGDRAGTTIRGAGDLNADAVNDILLGAPGVDVPGPAGPLTDAGRAYLILSQIVRPPGEIGLEETGVTQPGIVFNGRAAFERLGESLAGAGDLDGTGTTEIVLGAPADAVTSPGTVYIAVPVVSIGTSDLQVTGGAIATLEWRPAPGATRHLVYRGFVSGLAPGGVATSAADCLTPGGDGVGDSDADGRPDLTDATAPPIGEGFWYAVTGANALGEGPLGTDSAGVLRRNDGPCP